MRALDRNKQTIYYANYVSKTDSVDANGFHTGESSITYTTPTSVRVSVSAARGQASVDMFGTEINYTKTIVADHDLGLDENSILWVETTPENDTPHDYTVVQVAKSINSVVYAIKKVDVS